MVNFRPGLGHKRELRSKNTATFEDALWFYEMQLIFSDRPRRLSELMKKGNYNILVKVEYCNGPMNYMDQLRAKLKLFTCADHEQKAAVSDAQKRINSLLSLGDSEIISKVIDRLVIDEEIEPAHFEAISSI